MKLKYSFFLTFLISMVIVFGWQKHMLAQSDDMVVSWETTPGSGIPQTNALYNAVMGDTNANGSRADLNRVYILQKGGVYWNTEHFQNKDASGNSYPLRFVGQTPDPTDVYGNPPTLQMIARGDGTVDGHILLGYGDVYMKNIYIIGSDNNGVQTYYQPMEFEANNLHCTFDSCVFERSNYAITAWNGANNEITFTNCLFRNLVERPITQQWSGRGITMWADEDSVIVENCTFYNVGFTAIQLEGGAANYLRFDHNTLINVGRGINTTPWLREAYFANNLYINTFFDGEGFNDYSLALNPSRDPRAYTSGMFSFAAIPSSYGPDLGRRILVTNSAAFLAQSFRNAWDDTVRVQPYTNAVTDSFFNTYSPANGGQMVIKDTSWLTSVPHFTNFDTTNYTNMITFIKDIRAGISPAPEWMYNLQVGTANDTLWTAPSWPIKENFSYTDASLLTAGTDGFPLGDLNWFPTQHKQFLANEATYITQMQNIAGAKKIFTVKETNQAESGTTGGTAAVSTTQGLPYYDYTGAGSITWTFNVISPGQYDTRWLVNETSRGQSGPDLAINGNQFVDKAHGWGQFVFDPLLGPAIGQPNNQWIWVPITADSVLPAQASLFTLAAGSNTIGVVGGGWGEVQFSEVDVVLHGGTDTLKLKAPDAVSVLVNPGVVGAKWVPSGFKFVTMGAAGTDQWTINAPEDGTYNVDLFYQNYGGPQTGSIKIDGNSAVPSISLDSKTDSTGLNTITSSFPLTKGSHTMVFSGSNINLDYIQLIEQSSITGIKNANNQPGTYALSQNYPNPFNPSTMINFSIAKASNVELTIFNILGQKVATLVNGFMNAGAHTLQFNASNLASGVYFYGIKAGDFQSYKKMMLLK